MNSTYLMDDLGAQNLMDTIIKQAYKDYYDCCIVSLPNRIRIQKTVKGKTVWCKLDDQEYHLYCIRKEYARRHEKTLLLEFFHSPWFRALAGGEHARQVKMINETLKMIEYKRRNKIPLFGDKESEE